MFKKGFSMIELLFVMVILAALAAIAIPNMSDSSRATAITSMNSDMQNVINLVNQQLIKSQSFNYESIQQINGSPVFIGGDSINGFAEDSFPDGTKIPLTKDNSLSVFTESGEFCNGYVINIFNKLLSKEYLYLKFNSCNMTAPKLVPMLD